MKLTSTLERLMDFTTLSSSNREKGTGTIWPKSPFMRR